MSNVLKQAAGLQRRLPQSLFLMGTYENQVTGDVIKNKKLIEQDVLLKHRTFFPRFVKEASVCFKNDEFSTTFKRFKKCCFYHGSDRELYPSLVMMQTYDAFKTSKKLTSDDLMLMSMLAWSFETVITGLILIDDVLDGQEKRWKQLCWHNKPNIGLSAINDGNLMIASGLYMIKKYFKNHPSYIPLWNLMFELITETTLGQIVDIDECKALKEKRFESITMDWYITTSKYKSLIPIIKNPLIAAMHITNSADEYIQIKHIVEEKLGPHPQITNDIWDCFGHYQSFGKTRIDIAQGKLTWLIVKALEYASEEQKRLLMDNFAKPEMECQEIVMNVYRDLDLLKKYLDYKSNLVEDINKDVEKLTNSSLRNLINSFVVACVDVDDDVSY